MAFKLYTILCILISTILCGKVTLESKVAEKLEFDTHDELRMLDSAQCRSDCYNKNVKCCNERPNECGSVCFEEARKCYDDCRKTEPIKETKVNCQEDKVNKYNQCIGSGQDPSACSSYSENVYKSCISSRNNWKKK